MTKFRPEERSPGQIPGLVKFVPGQLVKLDPSKVNANNSLLAWFPGDEDDSDFILIRPGMIGMYIGERQDRGLEDHGIYKRHLFLFEEKLVLIRLSSVVAIEPEEEQLSLVSRK